MPKTVLITGGCGFIGRHLTDELLAGGYAVRVLDSLVEQVHAEGGFRGDDRARYLFGDLRDREVVREALAGVDCVVHLAAEVGVGQSMYEIARYVGGNDLGTAVLLEELIDRPVERIVVASSMSVYGEGLYQSRDGNRADGVRRSRRQLIQGQWDLIDEKGQPLIAVPTDEDKRIDLASIYALTKFAQEQAVLIFGEAYKVDAVALRLFNVFGPGQALSNPYTGVLANFAARLANGKPPLIFEDGEQRRDFVHVKDVARAFRLALEKPQAAGHAINIGSGSSYSIGRVAALVGEALGRPDVAPEILGKVRAGDIRNCFADLGKARELLGYEPRHRLEDSLGEFAAWVADVGASDRSAEMRALLEKRGLMS